MSGALYPGGDSVDYREGIWVGYRYYDTRKVPVQFPFGFGLSYTQFEYKDMRVFREAEICVEVTVKNVGERAGMEVVQLYTGVIEYTEEDRLPFRPEKELRAYKKIMLQPGQETKVRFVLDAKDFSWYDAKRKRFVTNTGTHRICVGKSSAEICFDTEIML